MAIANQLGLAIPKLADPFGGTLQHGRNAKRKLEFWSVGYDSSTKLYLRPRNKS